MMGLAMKNFSILYRPYTSVTQIPEVFTTVAKNKWDAASNFHCYRFGCVLAIVRLPNVPLKKYGRDNVLRVNANSIVSAASL
jgi:hypothetical protein